jgi:hypothetical protein
LRILRSLRFLGSQSGVQNLSNPLSILTPHVFENFKAVRRGLAPPSFYACPEPESAENATQRAGHSFSPMPGIHAPKEQGGRRYALFNQTLNVFSEGSRARGCSKTLQELLFQPFRLFHPVHAFHLIWALFASFIPHPWICQKKMFFICRALFSLPFANAGRGGLRHRFHPFKMCRNCFIAGESTLVFL